MGKLYVGNSGSTPAIIKVEEVPKTKFGVTIDNLLGDVDTEGVLNTLNIPNFEFVGVGIKTVASGALAYKFTSASSAQPTINITKILLPDLEQVHTDGCRQMASKSSCLVEVNLGHLSIVNNHGAFSEAFADCYYLMNTGLDNVTEITSTNVFDAAYYNCNKLQSTSLDNLTIISGNYACQEMFALCSSITSTGLHNLTSISGNYACENMFNMCEENLDIGLEKLESISGSYACQKMFAYNTKLTTVYFPMLTIVSTANAMGRNTSSGMFAGCTNLTEIHFRVDARAVIESLTGYSDKFGATNATIYFDL